MTVKRKPVTKYRKIIKASQCRCGELQVDVAGVPKMIHGCHCGYCSRRCGSPEQFSCWFFQKEVCVRGKTKSYKAFPQLDDSFKGSKFEGHQQEVEYYFCPTCGSVMYWTIPLLPGMFGPVAQTFIGMALGFFTDEIKDFPRPSSNHWTKDQPEWFSSVEFLFNYDGIPGQEETAKEPTPLSLKIEFIGSFIKHIFKRTE